MKKLIYLFLALFAITSYGQADFPEGIQISGGQPTVSSTNFLTATDATGLQGKISPNNVPITYTPINYAPSSASIADQLAGIDTRLGQIGNVTAGVTTRVHLTGDNITVTAGTFFASNTTGKGATAAGTPQQTLSNNDDQKQYFTKDVMSVAVASLTTAPPGVYSGQLTVTSDPTPGTSKQRFTIEIYKTNNGGTPIASGITGAPVGNLGVTVVAILDSGLINVVASALTNVGVQGNLASTLTLSTGERLRYHVSAEKVGTDGGAVTMNVYYGTNYNSYYDIPVTFRASNILNDSDVAGQTVANALNTLDTSINTLGDYSNFKPAVTITNDGSYNAFPSIEKASNGDLLTVYRKGVTHLTFDGSIRLKRSTDNGKTWSSESTIITGVGHDYRDPSLTKLANGNIIMSYFDRITSSNILIYTSISTDNGVTFGTPVNLTGYADYGAVSSKVIQLVNGDLLLATYGKSGANGLLNVFKSTNNGTSWSILSNISTDAFGSALKYTEPSLILASNGDIIATVRNDDTAQVARSISTNSGATWSELTDKFAGNSRASMFYSNNVLYTNYRGTDGNAYMRFSSDSGVTFGSAIKLSSNEVGEQNEYSGVTLLRSNTFAYVYSTQNSTATAAYIKVRYLNDPISMGDIPYFQTEGLNSTGSASVAGSFYNNNILGLSGGAINISTNTSNTASNIILKAGNTDRVTILGTGFVGFGKSVPTQVVDVVGNGAFTGFVSVPLMNTQQVRSNSSAGILKLVGGATNYGGSIDVVGTSFGTNNGGINFRAGLAVGESPVVASFDSAGLFNVVGSITATSYSGTATLTGNPTAPTPTAGDNDTSIATTAFVTSAATSGSYTPTISSTVNLGSVTNVSMTYYRVGNLINCSFRFLVNPGTPVAGKVSFKSTLPINKTGGSGVTAVGSGIIETPTLRPVLVKFDSASTIQILYDADITAGSSYGAVNFQYLTTE